MAKVPTQVSKYMSRIGKIGGKSRSAKKTLAVQKNGTKGGRPKLPVTGAT